MGKIGQNPKNWEILMPRSSAILRHREKFTGSRKLTGPWTTSWSKQYLSAVHPVTSSLL